MYQAQCFFFLKGPDLRYQFINFKWVAQISSEKIKNLQKRNENHSEKKTN